jgi:hypothetical protein
MLRIFTDFNARTASGACWNLVHESLGAGSATLKKGDRVILFQDEDDFEVEALIDFRYVGELKRKSWIAIPDWSTKKSLQPLRRDSAAE